MIYSFDGTPAYPNDGEHNEPLIQTSCDLTADEIERIREYGLHKTREHPVGLFGGYTREDVHAHGGVFDMTDECRWIYDRMAGIVRAINDEFYGYDVNGFCEPFYFRSYGVGDHFNWHTDRTGNTVSVRKLTCVLQLSKPDEYEGGDFEIMWARGPIVARKGQGIVSTFPSLQIHRVTPITKGERHAMTMFLTGPRFR